MGRIRQPPLHYTITVEVKVATFDEATAKRLTKDCLNTIKHLYRYAPNGKPTGGITARYDLIPSDKQVQ